MYSPGSRSWVPFPLPPNVCQSAFSAGWRLLRISPSNGVPSRYITLFCKGIYSVVSYYEMVRVPFAVLKHFLRQVWGNLSLFLWSY